MNGPLVTIYIREPFAEEILISEEVTPTELMSDIGGLMGLFMGCSFVSAVEIVYHILKVCKHNGVKNILMFHLNFCVISNYLIQSALEKCDFT